MAANIMQERLTKAGLRTVYVWGLAITPKNTMMGDLKGVVEYLGLPVRTIWNAPVGQQWAAVMTTSQKMKLTSWLARCKRREGRIQARREDLFDSTISDRNGGDLFRLEWGARKMRVPVADMAVRDWSLVWRSLVMGERLKMGQVPVEIRNPPQPLKQESLCLE